MFAVLWESGGLLYESARRFDGVDAAERWARRLLRLLNADRVWVVSAESTSTSTCAA